MKEWFIFIYYSKEDAVKCFEVLSKYGFPTILFEDMNYPPQFFAVATYSEDDELAKIHERPTSDDHALGDYAIHNLLTVALIINASNIPIKDPNRGIDEVIEFIYKTTKVKPSYMI